LIFGGGGTVRLIFFDIYAYLNALIAIPVLQPDSFSLALPEQNQDRLAVFRKYQPNHRLL
jgi:hypothetical protein